MLENKTILITGCTSMIGIALFDELFKIAPLNSLCIKGVTHEECDLLSMTETREYFVKAKPNIVIHLATYSGNVQFNQRFPADTYYRTSQIGLNVLKAASELKVDKILSVISSCAIADKPMKVLEEQDLWDGLPNNTIESHGLAKRTLHAFSRQINSQYKIPAICCIVNNSFGPYDAFSIEKGKVVSNLIKRFVEAKEKNLPSVTMWGSGIALRELVYCKDVARLLILALEKYNDSTNPINIGSPEEISIKNLANVIANVVGYKGELLWDHTKGDGQLRKKLDLTRMNEILLENKPFDYTDFTQAIQDTVNWYRNHKKDWDK